MSASSASNSFRSEERHTAGQRDSPRAFTIPATGPIDACALLDQFEQHIRAVCGWPLGDPARHSDAVMENLIGQDAAGWRDCAKERQLCVHLYGKEEARPGRKMGHVTQLKGR